MQIDITALICAALGIVASITVAAIQSRAQHNETLSEMDKRDALQAQRIEQLEKKMDKHNQLIERVYRLEQHNVLIDEQIKVANHRIDDLEKK
jgi:predicted nuclease with TOPRIM domain